MIKRSDRARMRMGVSRDMPYLNGTVPPDACERSSRATSAGTSTPMRPSARRNPSSLSCPASSMRTAAKSCERMKACSASRGPCAGAWWWPPKFESATPATCSTSRRHPRARRPGANRKACAEQEKQVSNAMRSLEIRRRAIAASGEEEEGCTRAAVARAREVRSFHRRHEPAGPRGAVAVAPPGRRARLALRRVCADAVSPARPRISGPGRRRRAAALRLPPQLAVDVELVDEVLRPDVGEVRLDLERLGALLGAGLIEHALAAPVRRAVAQRRRVAVAPRDHVLRSSQSKYAGNIIRIQAVRARSCETQGDPIVKGCSRGSGRIRRISRLL